MKEMDVIYNLKLLYKTKNLLENFELYLKYTLCGSVAKSVRTGLNQ